jgi:hypothetical protein
MTHSQKEPDARELSVFLEKPGSPTRTLLARAQRLADIESAMREWAGKPLALSLSVANERDGTLVIYTTSAAALTQVRYRQQELIQFLHRRLGLELHKLEIKNTPSSP